jgi:hypothetical protein
MLLIGGGLGRFWGLTCDFLAENGKRKLAVPETAME